MVETVADAVRWRDQLAAAASANQQKALTLGTAWGRFIEDARAGVALNRADRRYKATTLDDYEIAMHQHALPALADRRLDQVERGDVQQLIDTLVRDGVGWSRIQSCVTAIRALWRWASLRKHARHGEMAGLSIPRQPERDEPVVPLEPEQVLAAVSAIERLDVRACWALAAWVGARAQECAVATWSDILWDDRLVKVAKDPLAQKTVNAKRTAGLIGVARRVLWHCWTGLGRPDGPILDAGRGGSVRTRTQRLRRLAAASWEASGVEPIGMQQARHAVTSWMFDAGVPLPVMRDWLGHSSGASLDAALDGRAGAAGVTLDVYGHSTADAVGRATRTLELWLARQSRALPTIVTWLVQCGGVRGVARLVWRGRG
ncbi:tyrosine-type recombinase/integrase [Patulibacter medicamentivorans]|uniref:tyrosine-type recombinase/integrase n=1 Tax=Patulibacter medicamentivorans TaxID=1097667 RepID=UPI00058D2A34|nr:tyrosine-type recombinase/integrase [Patulibacter medicamentivorans]